MACSRARGQWPTRPYDDMTAPVFGLLSLIHMTKKLYRAKELKILAFGAEIGCWRDSTPPGPVGYAAAHIKNKQ